MRSSSRHGKMLNVENVNCSRVSGAFDCNLIVKNKFYQQKKKRFTSPQAILEKNREFLNFSELHNSHLPIVCALDELKS